MNKLFNRLIYVCAVLLMLIPLVSCSGGGGGASGTAGGTTGTLSIGLTDAPGDYQNVWVTIKEIQVNKAAEEEGDDSGWLTVFTMEETIDLKTLENGEIFDFGLAKLEAGQYNQMRLIIDEVKIAPHPFANYLVIEGAQEEEYVIGKPGEYAIEELKVPGGVETGIKIHKFEIEEQGTTALVLDFDAKTSVVKNGKSGKWHLKPNIKVLETVQNSIGDNAIAGSEGGVDVSAQIYTPEPVEPTDPPWDPMDEVTVEGTAESDDEGYYKIFLPLNTYNVVATKDGFIPECLEVQAEFFEDLTDVDFALEAEPETITISGVVSGLATDTDTAQLSIRQLDVACVGGATNVTIEVASDRPVNGDYSITVPAGIYDLVATDGTTTLELEGLNADTTGQNLDFTP